jgi:hypothetical protein
MIEETIEFLSSAIHRVQLTTQFPGDVAVPQLENVRCAAVNLSTAVIKYMETSIQHLKKPLSGLSAS